MKLQHIRQSLDEIKKDDLIILEELKNKISELEQSLNKKYTEKDEIETRKEIINNILNIKANKKRFLRMLRPVLEFVLMVIASVLIVMTIESMSALLLLFICFILGVLADALNIIQNDYSKITEKDGSSIGTIVKALCNVFMKKNALSINMENCLKIEEIVNSEITELEKELHINRSKIDSLKDEVSYIDGNAHAVNCLINKYKFEDMNNDNALVQFIESKKELKKTITPVSSC
ncbi:MAG: hypothetical protein K2G03_06790 [Bacilli bacterium]|nr:hypothetical protein [Bacilli bacterium]